jgi:subtilisin-like proprotein convertase family protein
MKTTIQAIATALGLLATYQEAGAILSSSWTGSSTIPDNTGSGLAFSFTLSDSATAIAGVSVTLTLAGGWNGDLYAYLSHGSGFTVLLNRVGVGTGNATGYGDPGYSSVTLSSAGAANVHFYQSSSPTYDGAGRLTGTWQPDGRNILPNSAPSAFDAAGSANFSTFSGLNPNGDWTIYFADVSSANQSTLNGWSVDITAVPEPAEYGLMMAALAAGAAAWHHWRQRRKR